MRRRIRQLWPATLATLLIAAVLPSIAAAQAPLAGTGPVPAETVRPHPCRVPGLDEEVKCASYAAWEDREARRGRKIGLNVVILPALGSHPEPDPIFFFGGGPGEGIAGAAPGLAEARDVRQKREIVLVDQRGTGRSNPLDCVFYGDPVDLRRVAGDLYPLDQVRACRDKLERIADLRLYTTALGMDDVDEVRQWLGYGKINLAGGSYGTRAAQAYLHRHPGAVRSVVLIAIAPLDEFLPLHHAYAGQRALDLLAAECAADAACHAAFPSTQEELRAVMERIAKGVKVTVTDPRTKAKVEVEPSLGLVAEGMRFLMYGEGGRNLPLQIHLAAQGDLAPLVQNAIERRLQIDEVLAMGLLFSVTCAEDLPFIDDVTAARETRDTFLGDYRIRQQKAVCEIWPHGKPPADVHELVRSDVPVLLISGERDPVTPPEFAERVAKNLPNSLHVVVPHGTHGGAGDCTDHLTRDFIDRGSVQGLDAACVKQAPPAAFVTSLP
ncbi:MAG TPA: alpha/beta hydrolase [Thermoanaerobaculia bacterium]|nr:alpha/beta hydrolase [Thermoanaerobaculia bacterium]